MAELNDPATKYKIAINLIPGVGGIIAKKLIEFAGSPEEVFNSDKDVLQKIPGIGKTLAESITSHAILDEADKEIGFLAKYRIKTLYYLDDDYPERLKECPDSPVILYVKGNTDLDNTKALSIVGTRNATRYGLDYCRNLVSEIVARGHNPLIISGLAYGIDVCAHKSALDNGLPTVAVLAHGLATIYPSAHRHIAGEIINQGALVTDFVSGFFPERGNFIRRNRIIAGLADATIVIESSKKGGALITADLANSYNRDVFALPGRVNDKRSQGCNHLIKTNKAALIEGVRDIEYLLGWSHLEMSEREKDFSSIKEAGEEEKSILRLLTTNGELSADYISNETGFSAGKTSYLLLNLEFLGYITSLPGKVYRLSEHLQVSH